MMIQEKAPIVFIQVPADYKTRRAQRTNAGPVKGTEHRGRQQAIEGRSIPSFLKVQISLHYAEPACIVA